MTHATAAQLTLAPERYRMMIGGRWVPAEGERTVETINPATGEKLGEVPLAGAADVDHAVQAAAAATEGWGRTSILERARLLGELARRIREKAEEFAILDTLDLGSPIRGMRADALDAAANIEYYAGLARELKGESLCSSAKLFHYTLRQPFGVVARIIPFNHPFKFAASKIAAPLLAGNTIVLKPAEQTPLSALELAKLTEGLFPAGVINVITGDGPTTGAALVSHPSVRRIALIGGVETGRAILRAAAEGIKTVTLELGGKNPMIVFPDADLAAALDGAVAGMNFTRSQGQSCGSTSRLFLHESVRERFLPRLVDKVRTIRIGLPIREETEMGCLVSQEHYDKVMAYIHRGQEEGATLLTGGRRPAAPELAQGYFVEPTIFDRVTPAMTIAREEIFGPVLSVLTWTEEEEMLRAVNGVIYGLTASIWTRDMTTAQRVAERVEAGYVWINGCSRHYLGMPFGGWKQSGVGREESLEELWSYTQTKAVTLHL